MRAAGGTHWMHAHTLQEQALLAAPLIVRLQDDLSAGEQELVVLLHDFSFTPAAELLATLKKGSTGHGGMMQGMDHGAMMHAVRFAFEAVNPGEAWALHCHHLYHMAAGMMSAVAYEA